MHVTVDEVQAWLETTKLTLDTLQPQLEGSVSDEVLARASYAYTTTGWTDNTTTPNLIRRIIAMKYAAAAYASTYSEDSDLSDYAVWLERKADMLLEGVVSGALELVDLGSGLEFESAGDPAFYPNDTSSALDPRDPNFDSSVGPAAFSMGQIF
jgi:hypothetical protein